MESKQPELHAKVRAWPVEKRLEFLTNIAHMNELAQKKIALMEQLRDCFMQEWMIAHIQAQGILSFREYWSDSRCSILLNRIEAAKFEGKDTLNFGGEQIPVLWAEYLAAELKRQLIRHRDFDETRWNSVQYYWRRKRRARDEAREFPI
jgi:hypothetical protein